MDEEERFLTALRTRPLFHEALASAPSMDDAREIARSHGFDVDESLIRASLLTHRPAEELDEADLEAIRGGSDDEAGAGQTGGEW